ncbi:hypothetical protein [Klebsiella sp. BIGb0407]|uniref:hypothetical protein n=1 Tax=Klebsiella sp. BIGb0407 TaxID=2940603 RepID=UPI002166C446|nr:hypothetical protein [Klebsiella sp. BIGb0407]MCS3434331.1 hypothetical protein [Klebsiella sp. BIGb0407]
MMAVATRKNGDGGQFASTLKRILYSCLGIGLLFVLLLVVERLVWVNADRYPVFLTEEIDVPLIINAENFSKIKAQFDAVCGEKRGSMAVVAKENGTFLRCDNGIVLDAWLKGTYKINGPEKAG